MKNLAPVLCASLLLFMISAPTMAGNIGGLRTSSAGNIGGMRSARVGNIGGLRTQVSGNIGGLRTNVTDTTETTIETLPNGSGMSKDDFGDVVGNLRYYLTILFSLY